MITAAMLARMQGIVAANFDQMCTVQRVTHANDGKGHDTQVWTTLNGGPIACAFFQPQGGAQVVPVGGIMASSNLWKLQVPAMITVNGVMQAPDIRSGDRILLGNDVLHVQTVNSEESLRVCLDITVQQTEGSKEDTPNG